jgi:hypothetical protein
VSEPQVESSASGPVHNERQQDDGHDDDDHPEKEHDDAGNGVPGYCSRSSHGRQLPTGAGLIQRGSHKADSQRPVSGEAKTPAALPTTPVNGSHPSSKISHTHIVQIRASADLVAEYRSPSPARHQVAALAAGLSSGERVAGGI